MERYSLGIGDRFGREGTAQLSAFAAARRDGVAVTPVWNKSNREHMLTGTEPADVRREADAAVAGLGWTADYFVDADHVGRANIGRFLDACDFFTLDVADAIGREAPAADLAEFRSHWMPWTRRTLDMPGMPAGWSPAPAELDAAARKFFAAAREAAETWRTIPVPATERPFHVEISMDETAAPQTPAELLVILIATALFGVPVRTIAPRFPGAFHKGVDFEGDLNEFDLAFRQHLAVLRYAVADLGLPADLRLSLHSGSDKFRLYPVIRRALSETGAGLHVKTAGTTWLEEVIGLASVGGAALDIVREIYRRAWPRFSALVAPYAAVVGIRRDRLPSPESVGAMDAAALVAAIHHDPSNPSFNPDLRQLFHVAYPIAAEMGQEFLDALDQHRDPIAARVAANIGDRHLRPLFGMAAAS